MAQWYSMGQQYYQPQQQLGQLSDPPYAPLPHPAYLAPAYSHAPYAYASVPMTVNGMPHVWVPVKLNAAAAPYPQPFSQMPMQQPLTSGRHVPFQEAPQCRVPSRRTPEHDPLQMTWPDSPVNLSTNGQPHACSSDWDGHTRGEHSSWHTASRSDPSPPMTPAAGYSSLTQQAHAALSRQLVQMSISDEAASSSGTAFQGRSDTSVTSSVPADISEAAEVSEHRAIDDPARQCGSTTLQRPSMTQEDGAEAVEGSATWQWLTEGLLKEVMSQLPKHCRKRCRLICKRWQSVLDLHIQVMLQLSSTHALTCSNHSLRLSSAHTQSDAVCMQQLQQAVQWPGLCCWR